MKLTIRKSGPLFYWRIKARNGEIVADGEGYRNRKDCVRTLRAMFSAAPKLLKQLSALEAG